jgi:hypothetical protein
MEHERAIQNLAVECYLLGEMSPGERESFEEHYFECGICADDVRAAAQFIEDAKEILEDSTVPARARTRAVETPRQSGWDWLSWLRPQAAAAMIAALVVVIGVERFSTIPGLQRQVNEFESPRIVQSMVLREVTRGDAPAVKTSIGEAVVLVFDPPEDPALSARSPLRFIVKSADGHSVLETAGEAPDPGKQISISVPRVNLPAGDYTLVVQDAAPGKTGRDLGQYPFKLEH